MPKKRIIPKVVLESLYIEKQLALSDVAKTLRASVHTIRRNLIEHNIAMRDNRTAHQSHGMSDTRQYHIWQSLKTRCSNPANPQFKKYGARGISYPEEWETFGGFWIDMAKDYADDKTLDRIDGAKGYSKENCRWITYQGQNRNKIDNVLLTYQGETKCIAAWAAEVDIPQTTLYNRKRRGWSDADILSTPVQKQYARQ